MSIIFNTPLSELRGEKINSVVVFNETNDDHNQIESRKYRLDTRSSHIKLSYIRHVPRKKLSEKGFGSLRMSLSRKAKIKPESTMTLGDFDSGINISLSKWED